MRDWIIKYWLEIVFGAVLAGLGIAWKRLTKKVHNQKSLRDGTQALLRNEVIRLYEKYIEQGWIPIYAMENVLSMYNAYHALGGNGTITGLVEQIKALPNHPIEGGAI